MLAFLDSINSVWIWLSVSLVFLIVEILSFSTSGFLLCFFVGAFITGLFNHFISADLIYCLLCFASVTLVSVISWSFWYRRYITEKRAPSTLNNRMTQLIGLRGVLDEAIVSGIGRMIVGDTTWSIVSDIDYPAGTPIEVVGAQGIVLRVKKINE